jgi:hypothetical protein
MAGGARRPGGRPRKRGLVPADTPPDTAKGARGYKWRSFDEDRFDDPDEPYPDHRDYVASISTRHGAGSPRKVDPLAAELVGGLLERRPDLERYPEATFAWARAEARCLLLADWFLAHGLLDDKGKPTASESLLGQSERLAAQLRGELGLTPKGEAELAKSQSEAARSVVDLDGLRERGRQALAGRQALESAERLRDDGGHLQDEGSGS